MVCLRMSIGVEEEASKLLTQPKADFLVLMDVQFSSQRWKDMLQWRIKQALKSSKIHTYSDRMYRLNPTLYRGLIIIIQTNFYCMHAQLL